MQQETMEERFDNQLCEPDDADIDGGLIFKENDPELVKSFISSELTLRTKEILEAVKLSDLPFPYIHSEPLGQALEEGWRAGWSAAIENLEAKKAELINRYLKEGEE